MDFNSSSSSSAINILYIGFPHKGLLQLWLFPRLFPTHIHHVSTMAEEIKNVKDYIYIQKIRFGDRIDFSLCYDEKADKGKIPRLYLK